MTYLCGQALDMGPVLSAGLLVLLVEDGLGGLHEDLCLRLDSLHL